MTTVTCSPLNSINDSALQFIRDFLKLGVTRVRSEISNDLKPDAGGNYQSNSGDGEPLIKIRPYNMQNISTFIHEYAHHAFHSYLKNNLLPQYSDSDVDEAFAYFVQTALAGKKREVFGEAFYRLYGDSSDRIIMFYDILWKAAEIEGNKFVLDNFPEIIAQSAPFIYSADGRHSSAAEMFQAAGAFDFAIEEYLKADRTIEACILSGDFMSLIELRSLASQYDEESVNLYHLEKLGFEAQLAGDIESSIKFYRKAFSVAKLSTLRDLAEICEFFGYEADAEYFYAKGRDYGKAGKIAEDLGDIDRAIQYYECDLNNNSFSNAARLYEKKGDFTNAIVWYLQVKDHDSVARILKGLSKRKLLKLKDHYDLWTDIEKSGLSK